MNWLMVLLTLALTAVAVLSLVFYHQNQTKWMRIFSEKQGVPINIMDGKPEPKMELAVPDKRRKISIPIPGAQFFRK